MLSDLQRVSLEYATDVYAQHLDLAAPYLSSRGISKATAQRARLGYVETPVRGDDHMTGRLSIPYITTSGVVGIRYRALGEANAKYLSRDGAHVHLYGVMSLTLPQRTAYITEGEMDCLTLQQCGLAAVGVPGVKSWKSYWRLLFADFDVVNIIADGDEQGRDFSKGLAEKIEGSIVTRMPDGEDVNSMFITNGKDALLERIGAG